jgi:hypothetical protein
MNRKKTIYRDPSLKDKSPLRRYMDLPKFVDLLRTRSLYLRRADGFSDRFEGALTPSVRAMIDSLRDSGRPVESADVFYERCRKGTFVSCWTFGEKDNMALWQLFGGTKSSVAITTTAGRLTRLCMGWSEDAFVEKVKYIDHFKDPNMVVGRYSDLLCFKHEAFDFEREVRLMISIQSDWQHNPTGVYRPILDLADLITAVVVAPDAESWFFALVQDLIRRYELKVPVRKSQLAELPASV